VIERRIGVSFDCDNDRSLLPWKPRLSPGSLNPHDMSFRVGALLLFGSIVGTVAAVSGQRQAAKKAVRLF
jgi:hypothetical protein